MAGVGTLVLTLAVVALAIALLQPFGPWLGPRPPIRHEDGHGPLASANGAGWESKWITNEEPSETFGYRLCVQDPSVPATIESVQPLQTVGTGFHFLGARVRLIDDHEGSTPIGSVHPFPPNVTQPLEDAVGAQVSTSCADRVRYTEIDLGLGRDGLAGGGWYGFQITYKAKGQEYVLLLHDVLVLCGPDVPDDQCKSGLQT